MSASASKKRLGFFAVFLNDFGEALHGRRPMVRLASLLLGTALCWWLYVPLHELLHAAGCALGGGTVTRLEIAPLYGGSLIAKAAPFVVAEGEYAGRLSGFDTGGSDWVYALLVAFPYLLTPVGFALVRLGARVKSSVLFGFGAVPAFSPIIGLTGDFLELGSLLLYQFWPGPDQMHRQLISDDLFRLLGQIAETAGPERPASILTFALVSQLLAALLAWGAVWIASRRYLRRPGS